MADIGTATVRVVPDMSSFVETLREGIGDLGVTWTETTTYSYDDHGRLAQQVVIRTATTAP